MHKLQTERSPAVFSRLCKWPGAIPTLPVNTIRRHAGRLSCPSPVNSVPEKIMKVPVLAASILFLMSSTSYAGFIGPSDTLQVNRTVQDSVKAEEMTTCVLEGNIVRHTEKNRYIFQDKSGTMTIDIPPHVFGQVDVTPQDTVRITGEIGGKKKADKLDTHLRVRYIDKIY